MTLLFVMFASLATAAVLTVGPNQKYETPCLAISAASAGDTIQIDASGTYEPCSPHVAKK